MSINFKLNIINACRIFLTEKTQAIDTIMIELSNSANNETKSSAGDKHETGRAMMQLEQEKLSKQITDLANQKNDFDKIDFLRLSTIISQGSLVETNKGYFFIATSLGKLIVDNKIVFVISSKSPLAVAFAGKQQKDFLRFNGVEYVIEHIF